MLRNCWIQKHGFNNDLNIYAADPYSGALEKRSDKDKTIEQLNAKVINGVDLSIA